MLNISGTKLFCNLSNVISKKPITADIFLTDFCNNKCPWCTYARYGSRNGEYMNFENFKRYAEILIQNGVKGIILTGGGEPTISPDFDKIVSWLEENNIEYGINTNFNIMKYFSPRYLKVSLDGWDEESYKRERGVEKYNQTIKNINEFLAWRNPSITSVGIQMIATSVEAVEKFYNTNKKLNVDYMNMRPMESTLHEYYNNHNESDVIAKIQELQKIDDRVVLNYKWSYLREGFDKCYAHFAQIALNQRGDVIYCCHKPYEIIGHITDEDIFERYQIAKTNMSKCDVPCRLSGPNVLIRDIEKSKDTSFI